MANNALGMALNVLTELPALITAGDEVVQLVTSTVSTIQAAQAQGRDPTQAEWDAIHSQIDNLTGQLNAPEDGSGSNRPDTSHLAFVGTGDAAARGDGTGVPTAKPQDVVGTAANPDPAGVSPGPMFDEAHGQLGLAGAIPAAPAIAPPTPEQQDALDNHPTTPPSAEAMQVNPVNPDTGAAAGGPTPATDAQKAFIPDPANPAATQAVMHPGGASITLDPTGAGVLPGLSPDPNAQVGDVPQAKADQINNLTQADTPIDNTVPSTSSGVGATTDIGSSPSTLSAAPASASGTPASPSASDVFASEQSSAESDFAASEAKARADLDEGEAKAKKDLGL